MSAPTPADLISVFGRIGLLSFGGPAAQIALMQRELVDVRPWLTEKQFLRALSFCMLLPGPEAMQLATYAGWRLHGTIGGLIAGLLFVLPGAMVILALALLYVWLGDLPLVQALFLGVKAAVVVIVVEALLKVSKRALKTPIAWIIAAASFIAIFVFALPFPLIIASAALVGAMFMQGTAESEVPLPKARGTLTTLSLWAAIWLIPLAMLWLIDPDFLAPLATFFSKLAVVTFGGAYTVLAYMTQTVVQDFGWITTAQMMDALGLAETTPGPLILVTEFVGLLAGHAQGGFGVAIIAGVVTLWMTFTPCFLWIFTGAPYIDWLASRPRLTGALTAITAAVVGVILNLSLWFAIHVFFADQQLIRFTSDAFAQGGMTWPIWGSALWQPVLLAVLSAYLLLVRHIDLLAVLAMAAFGAILLSYLG